VITLGEEECPVRIFMISVWFKQPLFSQLLRLVTQTLVNAAEYPNRLAFSPYNLGNPLLFAIFMPYYGIPG